MISKTVTIHYSDISFTINEDPSASRTLLERLIVFFESLNLHTTITNNTITLGLLLERPVSRLVGPDEVLEDNLNFVSDKILRHVLILIKNTLSEGRYELITDTDRIGKVLTYIYDNELRKMVPVANLEDHLSDLYTHKLETISVLDDRLKLLEFIRLGDKLFRFVNHGKASKLMKDISSKASYSYVDTKGTYITSFSHKGITLATNFEQLLNNDKALLLSLGAILTKQ